MIAALIKQICPWWARMLLVLGILVAAAAFGAVKMHQHDEKEIADVRAERDKMSEAFAAFRGQQAALGRAQSKAAADEDARRAQITQQTEEAHAQEDADHERSNRATLDRLRDDIRSGALVLPGASAPTVSAEGSSGDDGAAVRRAVQGSLAALAVELEPLALYCAKQLDALNTAKSWAAREYP